MWQLLCSQAAQAQASSDDHLGSGNHGKNGIIYNWFHKVEILVRDTREVSNSLKERETLAKLGS